ncbi:hypothetical protein L9F63_007289, partial [Diploptera punctata]
SPLGCQWFANHMLSSNVTTILTPLGLPICATRRQSRSHVLRSCPLEVEWSSFLTLYRNKKVIYSCKSLNQKQEQSKLRDVIKMQTKVCAIRTKSLHITRHNRIR